MRRTLSCDHKIDMRPTCATCAYFEPMSGSLRGVCHHGRPPMRVTSSPSGSLTASTFAFWCCDGYYALRDAYRETSAAKRDALAPWLKRIKRRPEKWEEIMGVEILDPDGWRGQSWFKPIDEEEWMLKSMASTVRYLDWLRQRPSTCDHKIAIYSPLFYATEYESGWEWIRQSKREEFIRDQREMLLYKKTTGARDYGSWLQKRLDMTDDELFDCLVDDQPVYCPDCGAKLKEVIDE